VDHVVVAGDTLSEIATAHGLTLAQLLAFPHNATYRKNPALIHVGDVVRVK
jgi:LysM repeat protein